MTLTSARCLVRAWLEQGLEHTPKGQPFIPLESHLDKLAFHIARRSQADLDKIASAYGIAKGQSPEAIIAVIDARGEAMEAKIIELERQLRVARGEDE